MIKLVTAGQKERWAALGQLLPVPEGIPWPLYLQSPLRDFQEFSADEVHEFVESLATQELDWPDNLPEQYFLLAWDNLNLSGWITRFGNWDLRTGLGQGGRMRQVASGVNVDLETGVLLPADGEPITLDGFLQVDEQGARELHWDNDSDRFAVYNDYLKQLLLMDRALYHSMLVRLLLADPAEVAEHFELVLDRFPWARVYRVR